jgi:hypothetical protein
MGKFVLNGYACGERASESNSICNWLSLLLVKDAVSFRSMAIHGIEGKGK